MLKRNSFSTFQIKSKCVFLERLSLSLFMSRVPTNYSNSPLPMYQSAFFTNLTNGSPHFRRKQTRNFLTYVYGAENGPIGRTTTRRLSPVFEEITRIRPFLRISRHFSKILRTEAPKFIVLIPLLRIHLINWKKMSFSKFVVSNGIPTKGVLKFQSPLPLLVRIRSVESRN